MIVRPSVLGMLLLFALGGVAAAQAPASIAIAPLDPAKLAAYGLRAIDGQHITLVTDLPASAAIDALPGLFDQAVPQWCAYFDAPAKTVETWRVRGYLIGDKSPFVAAGLLPEDLPSFANGFSRGLELWLNEQSTDYYRRHLFLHEGTHAFMNAFVGGGGPPWHMEGLAELLATHRLTDGRLELKTFPANREEVEGLGRIKLVRDAVDGNRLPTVAEIIDYDLQAHRTNEPYAMSWALCALLDGAPRYRQRFHKLRDQVQQADFNQHVRRAYEHDWKELNDDWLVFAHTLEHGHDLERATIDFAPPNRSTADNVVTLRADRGWQATGLTVEAGRKYRLSATGQYTVADQPKPWTCEPQGVSIRYVDGRPLGAVLAAVRAKSPGDGSTPTLVDPLLVGREVTFTPTVGGPLFVRINDSPAELADNAGTFEFRVELAD